MNALTIDSLSAGYAHTKVINDISCAIPEGVRCAIVGPNGAGKTTLMKSILGLTPIYAGSITFWGKYYMYVRDRIAYVPQRKVVDWSFPITVYDAVLMGAYSLLHSLCAVIPEHIHQKVNAALVTMGLQEFAQRHINDLSGGQQQRVFIARALVQNADLYLLDEPLTGLDQISEATITKTFFALQKENKTVVAVHHDWKTLGNYFDWVIFLNKRLIYNGPYKEEAVEELFKKTF